MLPHRRKPTRLPHLWDSPGKNTRVGCHFLLQCMKVKSESEVAQSCPTLCDPMDCSLPGSSVHGIFQARVLEWGAITFFRHVCNSHLYVLFSEVKAPREFQLSSSNLEQLLSKIFRADSENPECPERLSCSKFIFLARLSTMGSESWRPSRLRFCNLEQ